MDAITMLKTDHKTVEKLFKQYEKAGDRAFAKKRQLVDRIIEELSMHAAIEEQLFYPVARATVPGTEDIALESLEEHHIIKWVLSELETMAPEDERFEPKVTVLIENVRHHVQEEEDDFFPKVRDELGRAALNDLAEALAQMKKVAPTHPHPHAPDSPPGNLLVGAVGGVADKVGDTVSGFAQGSVTAVGDVIAVVLRRKKPRVSPTGSKAARKTAGAVRSAVADATDAVTEASSETVRRAKDVTKAATRKTARTAATAKRGTAATAKTARSGAEATTTSARNASKKTMSSAKRAATSTGRATKTAAKATASTAKRSAKKSGATAKRSSRAA
jgi:hemerythrin superfamily protein